MATAATIDRTMSPREVAPSARLFASVAVGMAVLAAVLAGWAPLGFSIITVFLFAGPHNWMEARYFLGRLPGRWGKLSVFFVAGFGGVFALTAGFASLPWLARFADFDEAQWLTVSAIWNTALVGWIVLLIQMRARQNPRRDWFWTVPVAFGLIALNWVKPLAWELGLVYLHPLVALWILDRELLRSRPAWRPAYHLCLASLPVLLCLLWWRLGDAPSLPGHDALTERITRHAGAEILQGVSTHLLVATHTFLEVLHYGVWLIAIPLVGLGGAPWSLGAVPLVRRTPEWRFVLVGCFFAGGVLVLILWGCFLADYPMTRDVYFTVAMLHVLAEVPFLLRAL
jgi:hypothetical protein